MQFSLVIYFIKIDDFFNGMEKWIFFWLSTSQERLLSSHSPINVKNVQCENVQSLYMCNRSMIINSIGPKYRFTLYGGINKYEKII